MGTRKKTKKGVNEREEERERRGGEEREGVIEG